MSITKISERELVSITEACRIVGVTRRTIYNWINAGKITYVRTAGGGVRIYKNTLWMNPEDSVGGKQTG